jgi:hypothetical protein
LYNKGGGGTIYFNRSGFRFLERGHPARLCGISIYTSIINLKTICYVKSLQIMARFLIAVPPKFGLEQAIISMKYRNYLFKLMIYNK